MSLLPILLILLSIPSGDADDCLPGSPCTQSTLNDLHQAVSTQADADSPVTDRESFFDREDLYYVQIRGWDPSKMSNESMAEDTSVPGAQVLVAKAHASSNTHCPDAEVAAGDQVHATSDFSVRTSGNFTKGTPKSSFKISFEGKEARLLGMSSLNLKSMWNDVSQMREAIAWEMFAESGVPAPGHAYAKLCINGRYQGLYSMVEQVDKGFLEDRFGKNDKGNLYKGYWKDIGPGDLSYRKDAKGDDSGRQYFQAPNIDDRTYQLKTNDKADDDPSLQTYNDLAEFIRVVNGVELTGGDEKYDTNDYQRAVEGVFDVEGFLRWAGTNMLLGAWDNYWATPANYYLYNSGHEGDRKGFMKDPYFHFIPWDYDNSLGIDNFNTEWQYADLLDWQAATRNYNGGQKTSNLPLITNLLKNDHFKAYYLDHIEHMLDTSFNAEQVAARIGTEGSGGLWDQVRNAAFLESDGPQAGPHTGRQWTNDQVYWNGFEQYEIQRGNQKTTGILHYVKMRHDSARTQLAGLRKTIPRGSSGYTPVE